MYWLGAFHYILTRDSSYTQLRDTILRQHPAITVILAWYYTADKQFNDKFDSHSFSAILYKQAT